MNKPTDPGATSDLLKESRAELPSSEVRAPTTLAARAPHDYAENSDFDWRTDPDAVFVHTQPCSAVYRNPYDQIVIRQQMTSPDNDDQFVFFNESAVPDLIRRLADKIGLSDEVNNLLLRYDK